MGKDQQYLGGTNTGASYNIGRVQRVVLDKKDPDYASEYDIGKIYFEILFKGKSNPGPKSPSTPAYPIFKFFTQYPIVGEMVMIVPGPSWKLNEDINSTELFYFPPFSVWGAINHNALPNNEQYVNFLNGKIAQKSNREEDLMFPLGEYFKEQMVKSLKAFEGDTIINGRFGQSIRFGSSNSRLSIENSWSQNEKANDKPITIITNGHSKLNYLTNRGSDINLPWDPTVENINYDDSSIYMTSGQTIVLEDINNFPLDSFGTGIQVQTQNVTVATDLTYVSNESDSAKNQDNKALGNG
jgi:hypothetical protein